MQNGRIQCILLREVMVLCKLSEIFLVPFSVRGFQESFQHLLLMSILFDLSGWLAVIREAIRKNSAAIKPVFPAEVSSTALNTFCVALLLHFAITVQ